MQGCGCPCYYATRQLPPAHLEALHVGQEGKGGVLGQATGMESVLMHPLPCHQSWQNSCAARTPKAPRRTDLRVDGVPALEDGGGVDALEEELEADGAVLVHCALHALVVALQVGAVAGAAGGAVEVVGAAADAADAAVSAVEGLLGEVVVEEGALGAAVRAWAGGWVEGEGEGARGWVSRKREWSKRRASVTAAAALKPRIAQPPAPLPAHRRRRRRRRSGRRRAAASRRGRTRPR